MAFGLFGVIREGVVGDVEEGEVGRGVGGIIGANVLFACAPDGQVKVFDAPNEGVFGGEVVGFEDTLEVAFGVGGRVKGEGFTEFEFFLFFYKLKGGVCVS